MQIQQLTTGFAAIHRIHHLLNLHRLPHLLFLSSNPDLRNRSRHPRLPHHLPAPHSHPRPSPGPEVLAARLLGQSNPLHPPTPQHHSPHPLRRPSILLVLPILLPPRAMATPLPGQGRKSHPPHPGLDGMLWVPHESGHGVAVSGPRK